MINWEHFEDMSVLENAYILEQEEEDALLEAFGLNVGLFNKDKLNDKEYVQDLIERINKVEVVEKDILQIIRLIDKANVVILSLTIIGIPVAILVNAISKLELKLLNKLSEEASISGTKSVIKAIDKSIDDLEKQKAEASETDKKKIDSTIKQLKENKIKLNNAVKELKEKQKAKDKNK